VTLTGGAEAEDAAGAADTALLAAATSALAAAAGAAGALSRAPQATSMAANRQVNRGAQRLSIGVRRGGTEGDCG
jgi:hypothetical protein